MRPAETCPTCSARPARWWLEGPLEWRRCPAGHTWYGDALPAARTDEDRLDNLEDGLSALLELAVDMASRFAGPLSHGKISEARTRFEQRRRRR